MIIAALVSSLSASPLNPRPLIAARVTAMRMSIRREGCLVPAHAIIVRARGDGSYEIIDGHHRAAAAREESLQTVPAHLVQATDRETVRLMAKANNHKEYTTLDKARLAYALKETGTDGDQSELAELWGVHSSRITRWLQAVEVEREAKTACVNATRVPVETLARIRALPRAVWAPLAAEIVERKLTQVAAGKLLASAEQDHGIQRVSRKSAQAQPKGTYHYPRVPHGWQWIMDGGNVVGIAQLAVEFTPSFLPRLAAPHNLAPESLEGDGPWLVPGVQSDFEAFLQAEERDVRALLSRPFKEVQAFARRVGLRAVSATHIINRWYEARGTSLLWVYGFPADGGGHDVLALLLGRYSEIGAPEPSGLVVTEPGVIERVDVRDFPVRMNCSLLYGIGVNPGRFGIPS